MGKKNNPNRDNSIGLQARLQDNSLLTCSIIRCSNKRYGFSKYCLEHKNHIAKTGDINQPYINRLKTQLKPYIAEMIGYIDSNCDDTTIKQGLSTAEHLLKYKHSINDISVGTDFNHIFTHNSSTIPESILDRLNTFRGDAKLLLAVVLSIYLFQQENKDKLHTGAPLFFHLGKLLFSYTEYEEKVSWRGKRYQSQRTLSRLQYLSIGVRYYIKFQQQINALRIALNGSVMAHSKQKEQVDIKLLPKVKKSHIEELRQEMNERIKFVKEQQKINDMITENMVQNEIKKITQYYEKMIEIERNKDDSNS